MEWAHFITSLSDTVNRKIHLQSVRDKIDNSLELAEIRTNSNTTSCLALFSPPVLVPMEHHHVETTSHDDDEEESQKQQPLENLLRGRNYDEPFVDEITLNLQVSEQ